MQTFATLIGWILIASTTIAASASASAQGESHLTSSGYRLRVPTGWEVLDAAMQRELRTEFSNLIDIDLDKIDSVAFDGTDDGFAETLNVVVMPRVAPVSASALTDAKASLLRQYRSMGLNPRNFTGSLARIADRDCFVFSYTAHFDESEVWQTQYMVPGEDVTYIVTCTAEASERERYRPVFDAVMQSFEVTGSGLGFWEGLPKPLRFALIGGGFGLIYSVLGSLFSGAGARRTEPAAAG